MTAQTVTALLVGASALTLVTAATGQAAPPTPGAVCPAAAERALSQSPDGGVVECRAGQWQAYGGPYPSSDRWVSGGDGLHLHGQGMRNAEMLSGPWTAIPLDPGARCRAEQTAVVSAGEVGPPQVAEGAPGQPLRFAVLPVMFSIHLTGDCLWQAG
ncbi:hypothetical protein E4P42_22775 [Mycobacterium sp. PS03-16]|uniref:hypothetical protein n=1 Tax=Mycobacterium sp. PS03-16 TaxID=2559611 RepID=UPI001073A159|nr:hypothetical protein [Mycobacterium sp. PS03-16]TFV55450.1 hypothetical protein E4P42_22775 [Mycobacterium sp. PS03-16]